MNISKEIEETKKFKSIIKLIRSTNINERAKKEILEKVEWELYYIEHNLIISLGKDEYNRLCAIEERNKKYKI